MSDNIMDSQSMVDLSSNTKPSVIAGVSQTKENTNAATIMEPADADVTVNLMPMVDLLSAQNYYHNQH